MEFGCLKGNQALKYVMDTHKAHLPLEVVSIYKLLLRGGTRREHLCLMHYRGDTRLRYVFNKYLIVGTKFRINAACTFWFTEKIIWFFGVEIESIQTAGNTYQTLCPTSF